MQMRADTHFHFFIAPVPQTLIESPTRSDPVKFRPVGLPVGNILKIVHYYNILYNHFINILQRDEVQVNKAGSKLHSVPTSK